MRVILRGCGYVCVCSRSGRFSSIKNVGISRALHVSVAQVGLADGDAATQAVSFHCWTRTAYHIDNRWRVNTRNRDRFLTCSCAHALYKLERRVATRSIYTCVIIRARIVSRCCHAFHLYPA